MVKISFVIPLYNKEKYIVDCVKSIEQVAINNMEIVIVDDYSEDNSYELCLNLQKEYNNIILYKNTLNCGLEQTRNKGIEMASGEWIVFVDADDLIDNHAINLKSYIQKSDADILLFNFEYFDIYNSKLFNCDMEDGTCFTSEEFAKIIGKKINWEMISCVGNKIYRREFLINNGIYFSKQYKYNEDGAFSIMALMNAQSIIYYKQNLYRYRRNDEGIMNSYKKDAYWSLMRVNGLLETYLKNSGCEKIQIDYLERKKIYTLLASIRDEIKNGSEENFNKMLDEIVLDGKISEGFNVFSDEKLESLYLECIYQNKRKLLVNLVKRELLNELFGKWLYMKQTKSIMSICTNQAIKRIAIYGAGDIGLKMAAEMELAGKTITCFIDRARNGEIINGKPCIRIDEYESEDELIINSVLTWQEEMNEYIRSKVSCNVVSVWKLIEDI